jgi:glycosyltransferase involved in cell wall biosynthesis
MFPKFVNEGCTPFQRSVIQSVLRNSAVTIALTDEWGRWLSTFAPGTTIENLGNPVAIGPSIRQLSPFPTVVFLGRLSEVKGINELLKAFKVVLEKHPTSKLILCGDGGYAEVRNLAESLGILANVAFPGWVSGSAKDQIMSSAWVFTLPSHFEGLPMGLLEAMSYGIASVASRVGGIPDLVEDGRDGVLIPVCDIGALSDSILRLIESNALRVRLGSAARDKVIAKYSSAAIENQLVGIYRKIGINL